MLTFEVWLSTVKCRIRFASVGKIDAQDEVIENSLQNIEVLQSVNARRGDADVAVFLAEKFITKEK